MREGLPATTTFAGTSFRTTLPAPMVLLSPIVTPGPMTTLAALQTFVPTTIGRAYSRPRSRSPGSTGWVAAQSCTPGPSMVSAPNVSGAQSRMTQLTLTYAPAPVSYTHLRAHETPEHLVCRLLLEKK